MSFTSTPPWAVSSDEQTMQSTSRSMYSSKGDAESQSAMSASMNSRRSSRPSARSTCPWSTEDENVPSRLNKNTSQRSARSTCPWAVDEEKEQTQSVASRKPARDTSPWAVDEAKTAPAPRVDQPPTNAPPAEDEELMRRKKDLVVQLMANECSEEQILEAMENLDLQYAKEKLGHAPMASNITAPRDDDDDASQYEEACSAAKRTAAKSQGQGVASIFYG